MWVYCGYPFKSNATKVGDSPILNVLSYKSILCLRHKGSIYSNVLGRSFPYRDFKKDTQACLQLSRLSLLTKHNQFCSLTSFLCQYPKDISSKGKDEFMLCFEKLPRVNVPSNLGNNQKYFNPFSLPKTA